MTQGFKKGLFIGLAQVTFVTSAFAYNVINLTVNSNDLALYKEKAEKYTFTAPQFRLNNNLSFPIEEMETRGQGSIGYRRKNFGLKLPQSIQVGRITAKKINLLSMSADPGYISTRLGLMTAELLNIGKPLPSEYAEVKINGKTNGLYAVVQKPKAAMSDISPYVVRRGYKSRFQHDDAEISKKLTLTQIEEIKAIADSIYTDVATKRDATLFNSLKQKMDIDAYMRWMAMNSLYRNGDFPDEIFFYVDGDMYKQGRIFFRVMPWDFDDLFKAMHSVPINATEAAKPENQDSILYSYEDRLDRSFTPSNVYMYSQFKFATRNVIINHLTQNATDKLLTQIHSEISEYLSNGEILQMGSQDSSRKNKPYTKAEIQNLFLKRKKQIDERRAYLQEKVK
ncbi:MAG: CotH kinase family protein [Bdellovibrionota bacterium]